VVDVHSGAKENLERDMVMNFSISIVCVLMAVCAVAGCTAGQTKLKPYQQYIGTVLTMKRPAALCDRKESNVTMLQGDVSIERGTFYQLTDSVGSGETDECYELYPIEEGTPVIIHQVYSKEGDGIWDVRASGKVYVEKLDGDVAFEYRWGGEYFHPAPWEAEDVEGNRYVGYDGMDKRQRIFYIPPSAY
jgi:hypothetical protein